MRPRKTRQSRIRQQAKIESAKTRRMRVPCPPIATCVGNDLCGEMTYVGTAALGCPGERSSPSADINRPPPLLFHVLEFPQAFQAPIFRFRGTFDRTGTVNSFR